MRKNIAMGLFLKGEIFYIVQCRLILAASYTCGKYSCNSSCDKLRTWQAVLCKLGPAFSSSVPSLILGDFNIHTDSSSDFSIQCFLSPLDYFALISDLMHAYSRLFLMLSPKLTSIVRAALVEWAMGLSLKPGELSQELSSREKLW